MRFTKEFLQEFEGETVEETIIGKGRWTVHYRRVFQHDGRFYVTTYSIGATESQDERPYEYDSAEIDCAEVFPREKTITVYEPVGVPV